MIQRVPRSNHSTARCVYYMYMNRRLFLLPVAAATVWAQQASPAEEETRKALISRVSEYYKLMVEKKYRQAESMVAEESRDDYYNGKKPDIKGFDILKVDLAAGANEATVTVKAKVLVLMLGAGAQIFDMPSPTHWKLVDGKWYWFIPEEVKHATPFGKIQTNAATGLEGLPNTKGKAPEMGSLLGQVTIDRLNVSLNAKDMEQTVTITNGLPGPSDLRIDPHVEAIKGLTVRVSSLHLDSGQKATVRLRWDGKTTVSDTVEIRASPLNLAFDIEVTAK